MSEETELKWLPFFFVGLSIDKFRAWTITTLSRFNKFDIRNLDMGEVKYVGNGRHYISRD